jgi:hypothetical protein
LLKRLGLQLKPVYTMADASDAQRNALETGYILINLVFPNAVHLMCFFHVLYNLKKSHMTGFTVENRSMIVADVQDLYHCLSGEAFTVRWADVRRKWIQKGLNDFLLYFENEWINSRFNNWKLYSKGPGIPGTNNSLEGFNNVAKNIIGKKSRYKIIPLINSNQYI